ncbi:hypothetical protein SBA5_100085 [Candidatus Sulfotelmatomonas gaucii]|uniref:Uncharacterized protein n=1 Tax=Candidatus Sulfuritelmatomonas gaucii TaxID=2043161 RepID=A0A2N9L2D5_9BACT|nr:hypothetical protein SBA5_100085 [Candidatus Sulfotelmatomonas gaucii]
MHPTTLVLLMTADLNLKTAHPAAKFGFQKNKSSGVVEIGFSSAANSSYDPARKRAYNLARADREPLQEPVLHSFQRGHGRPV